MCLVNMSKARGKFPKNAPRKGGAAPDTTGPGEHRPPSRAVAASGQTLMAADSTRAPNRPPRILDIGRVDQGGNAAHVTGMATEAGFSHIGLSPVPQASPTQKAPGHRGAIRQFDPDAMARAIAPFAGDRASLCVTLPWHCHAETSAFVAAHESWLTPPPAPSGAVADPRGRDLAGRYLRTDRPDFFPAIADWFADAAARLADAGAGAILFPAIQDAPADFWHSVLGTIRGRTRDILLIGDALKGAFARQQALDAVGFDYHLDNIAWWDGQAGWYPDQRAALSTPRIGFPLPGATGRHAVQDYARACVASQGLLYPSHAMNDATAGDIAAINALHERERWLAEKGRLLKAGGRGGMIRLPSDPRFADTAIGLAIDGDTASIRRLAGGQEDFMTAYEDDRAALVRTKTAAPAKAEKVSKKESLARLRELADERVAIEGVYPEIDGGRFPAKRIVGDTLEIAADIFCDGHEKLAACFWLMEPGGEPVRHDMRPTVNDRWSGQAVLTRMGTAHVTIEAWRDLFATWTSDIAKKRAAGQTVDLEVVEGRNLVTAALDEMDPEDLTGKDRDYVVMLEKELARAGDDTAALSPLLDDMQLREIMARHGTRTNLTRYERTIQITVDREAARFSAWYELFPRSQTDAKDRHGTLDDVIARLPYVRDLGFDVLYFPPIHPIGKTNRKGRNNTLTPDESDVGSPYAIGSEDGGHDALHPALGSLEDFDRLVVAAAEHDLEIALDFAIQCSPDHPWLKEHPEWFDWRPDGSIKFAENPPKKYEDIVNVHFYRDAIPDLWMALRDVILFWVDHGVKIFRVDNPHTKPYPFWEWMIGDVKARHPDVLFLSEAFTRPKVMKRLAKLGFTQSYTYYTWRNDKQDLIDYVEELTQSDTREVMNPNFFVNTPDINPPVLQSNNRAAHIARTILAGTLASSYGIYNGIEICEGTPLPGKEEYLDSEKYEIRLWDMDRPGNIKDEIRFLNKLRREHPALRDHVTVDFLQAWNDQVLWYAKKTPDLSDYLLFAVSLDFNGVQRAPVELPLWEFGLPDNGTLQMRDLRTGIDFDWQGKFQDLTLSPHDSPFLVFQIKTPPPADFRAPALYADLEGHG